jgi:hypothetical protein
MRKIIIILVSVFGIYAYLFSQNVNEYDTGYIASVKNNKCMKVKDYPGKDVRPSVILKDKSCEITAKDDSIKSLIIVCTDKAKKKSMMYSYAMDLETCKESLKIAKKKVSK